MSKNASKVNISLLTETNFILDIIFEQSQESERLFMLTREYEVPVVVPEYSFAEAEGNISNTLQNRISGLETAIGILKQSGRSAYQEVTGLIYQLQQFKTHSIAEERPLLHGTLAKLEENVGVIPFSADIAVQAELRGLRRLAPIKPSDRNVYESILHFARANQSPKAHMIFLTRDITDFDFPYLRKELVELSVELLFSAGDCVRRIRELLEI